MDIRKVFNIKLVDDKSNEIIIKALDDDEFGIEQEEEIIFTFTSEDTEDIIKVLQEISKINDI
mgnify:FL=1|tara:strand:+ start:440 stop:628 length:189 start_codon:yes stop_codon:yes gene_type:complete